MASSVAILGSVASRVPCASPLEVTQQASTSIRGARSPWPWPRPRGHRAARGSPTASGSRRCVVRPGAGRPVPDSDADRALYPGPPDVAGVSHVPRCPVGSADDNRRAGTNSRRPSARALQSTQFDSLRVHGLDDPGRRTPRTRHGTGAAFPAPGPSAAPSAGFQSNFARRRPGSNGRSGSGKPAPGAGRSPGSPRPTRRLSRGRPSGACRCRPIAAGPQASLPSSRSCSPYWTLRSPGTPGRRACVLFSS